MNIDNKFEINQTVYLVTDPEQCPHLCVGIKISSNGLLYQLACGSEDDYYFDIEISAEKNLMLIFK